MDRPLSRCRSARMEAAVKPIEHPSKDHPEENDWWCWGVIGGNCDCLVALGIAVDPARILIVDRQAANQVPALTRA